MILCEPSFKHEHVTAHFTMTVVVHQSHNMGGTMCCVGLEHKISLVTCEKILLTCSYSVIKSHSGRCIVCLLPRLPFPPKVTKRGSRKLPMTTSKFKVTTERLSCPRFYTAWRWPRWCREGNVVNSNIASVTISTLSLKDYLEKKNK